MPVGDNGNGVLAGRRNGRMRNQRAVSARSEALPSADFIVAAGKPITPGADNGNSGRRNISRQVVPVARREAGITAHTYRVAGRIPRPAESVGVVDFRGHGRCARRRTHQANRWPGAGQSPALHAGPKGGLLRDGLSRAYEQLASTSCDTRRWPEPPGRHEPGEGRYPLNLRETTGRPEKATPATTRAEALPEAASPVEACEGGSVSVGLRRREVIEAQVDAVDYPPPPGPPRPNRAIRMNVVRGLSGVIHDRVIRFTDFTTAQDDARVKRFHDDRAQLPFDMDASARLMGAIQTMRFVPDQPVRRGILTVAQDTYRAGLQRPAARGRPDPIRGRPRRA